MSWLYQLISSDNVFRHFLPNPIGSLKEKQYSHTHIGNLIYILSVIWSWEYKLEKNSWSNFTDNLWYSVSIRFNLCYSFLLFHVDYISYFSSAILFLLFFHLRGPRTQWEGHVSNVICGMRLTTLKKKLILKSSSTVYYNRKQNGLFWL